MTARSRSGGDGRGASAGVSTWAMRTDSGFLGLSLMPGSGWRVSIDGSHFLCRSLGIMCCLLRLGYKHLSAAGSLLETPSVTSR